MKTASEIAIAKLQQPISPLLRLLQILFLTGPFTEVQEILAELNEPIDAQCYYDDPQAAASPYLDILQHFEYMKNTKPLPYTIINEDGSQLDRMDSLDCWIGQQILTRELAEINSLLCGSEHCDLCCIGPKKADKQDFFEIPLHDSETSSFTLPKIDSAASRNHSPNDDQPLKLDSRPFYHKKEPGLYHWQNGWSLILPRQTSCPNLDQKGRCLVYPTRPQVCQKPQIFPYLLEPAAQQEQEPPTYIARRKLLAIWDCPYVKKNQDLIADYADLSGLEPIFKENKA